MQRQEAAVALGRLELRTVQRSRGRSMTASAAYRAGVRIGDRRTGLVFDFRRRTGVVATALFGPDGPLDEGARADLWNLAEAAEKRKDSVVGRELMLALPAEMAPAQRAALAQDFAAVLAREEGVVVDLALHAPSRRGDRRNHHAHLLFSSRHAAVSGGGEVAFGQKTKVWDHKISGGERLTAWRARFETITNAHLARAGSAARIDMRSNVQRGLTTPPGTHDGPAMTRVRRELGEVRRCLATAKTRFEHLATGARLGVDTALVASMMTAITTAVDTLHTLGLGPGSVPVVADRHRER